MPSLKTLSLAIACLTIAAACESSDIIVPSELRAGADYYEVEGQNDLRWKKQIRFGEYQVSETKKNFSSSSETEIFFKNSATETQNFDLSVQNRRTGNVLELDGQYNLKLSGFNLRGVLPTSDTFYNESEDLLAGAVSNRAAGQKWYFEIINLSAESWNAAEGHIYQIDKNGARLIGGPEHITIRQTHEATSSVIVNNLPTYGLIFSIQGRDVAAVQPHPTLKVWLSQSLSDTERDIIAAVAAAAMLRKQS